jgi:hypothetical protein
MKRAPRHHVFTIVTNIASGGDAHIGNALAERAFDFTPFGTLHFACFVIFPADKLKLDHAKLLLECNIDGPVDAFVRQLAGSPDLARIYRHCEGFEGADPFAYLSNHVQRPNLCHVGAPYRSVQSIQYDTAVCSNLADDVTHRGTADLAAGVRRSPPGMPEWWRWEVWKPWTAALLLFIAALAAFGVFATKRTAFTGFDLWLLAGFYLALFGVSAFYGIRLWITSRPELRQRVAPASLSFAAALAIVRMGAQGIGWWPVAAAAGAGLGGVFVLEEIARRRNVRLAAMRTVEGGSSPLHAFAGLAINEPLIDPRPDFRDWFGRWSPWIITIIGAGTMFYVTEGYPRALTIALTALAFLEAVWIATLSGWPAGGHWTHWHWKVVTYVVAITATTFLLVRLQFVTGIGAWVLVPIVVGSFLGAWYPTLPSPPPAPLAPVTRADFARLVDQEDRDVQNHMAAVVRLPKNWFRAASVQIFLRILSVFFFRSWLPDLFGGKLFGVPTVHFCQWVLLDDRQNYLFLSNYDHSWNAYLDDFGASIAGGLQKIWGQGIGNPGFEDVEAFKRYARSTMVPHLQWYQAYPGISLRQIWNNEQIRLGLDVDGDEEHRLSVLRRCGAAPKALPDFLHARVK